MLLSVNVSRFLFPTKGQSRVMTSLCAGEPNMPVLEFAWATYSPVSLSKDLKKKRIIFLLLKMHQIVKYGISFLIV